MRGWRTFVDTADTADREVSEAMSLCRGDRDELLPRKGRSPLLGLRLRSGELVLRMTNKEAKDDIRLNLADTYSRGCRRKVCRMRHLGCNDKIEFL